MFYSVNKNFFNKILIISTKHKSNLNRGSYEIDELILNIKLNKSFENLLIIMIRIDLKGLRTKKSAYIYFNLKEVPCFDH